MADIEVTPVDPNVPNVQTGTITTNTQGEANRITDVGMFRSGTLTAEFEGDNQYKPCIKTIRW